jgi:hypothetical protein
MSDLSFDQRYGEASLVRFDVAADVERRGEFKMSGIAPWVLTREVGCLSQAARAFPLKSP